MLDNKELTKAIIRSQHTQRNWDLSKSIPDEDLKVMLDCVTHCPSKQNFAFYKVHVIKNRETIENIHELSMGLGYKDENNERIECTNPQTLANVLFVFEGEDPSKSYTNKSSGVGKGGSYRDAENEELYMRDVHMAMGIASGYLNIISSIMGYDTGCCACFHEPEIRELLGLENKVELIMGIGFKDPNRERRSHHVLDVKIPRRVKEKIQVSTMH
jgi:nitroreductase|tara:strand:- start:1112 stop:1756 length:645 start_codon:yes stop_codon:yes gene_type:complete